MARRNKRASMREGPLSDLFEALRLGWEDFKMVPSHAIILCLIYPVLGFDLDTPGAQIVLRGMPKS